MYTAILPHGSRRSGNVGRAAPPQQRHCKIGGAPRRADREYLGRCRNRRVRQRCRGRAVCGRIQQEISSQDSDQPHAHQMRFRIGINLGDVMVDGSDIFGDGVNIAARLQELAEPGGVVVSASVYDQVHNKLSLGFDCLGQQQMKNVVPVISYRVTMGGVGRLSFPVDKGPTPQAGAVVASEAGAQRIRDRYEPSTWMSSITDRLAKLPRPIAATLTVSGFLILINVFTGLHRIWFHWPVAALLFIGILRTVLRHRTASDRNEDRRRRRE